MAEETKQVQVEEQGPPPWQMDFNPVVKYATEAVKTASETITTAVGALLPWNQDFSAKRPVEAPKPIEQPKHEFGSVFQKLIQAESGGVHETKGGLLTSSAGARGITQLMPATASNPGYGISPVQDNSKAEYLRVGKEYLDALVKDFGGDIDKAVAAYNYGPTAVKKLIKSRGENWKEHLPLETKKYLRKILG